MTHRPWTAARARARARGVAGVVLVLALTGCGGGSRAVDDPQLVGTASATPATPATTSSPTVPLAAAITTATAPASSIPATEPPATVAATTTVVLPVPEAPPDEQAVEPADQLGQLEIPRLGLDLSFFEGVALPTLDKGPGHWPGSAMPGQVGNVVIAGHRVSHSRPFRHIEELVEGDDVIFTVAGQRVTYVVTGTEIVTPDEVRIVDQTPEPTATLFACHPPGSTQFRWVTHLRLRA